MSGRFFDPRLVRTARAARGALFLAIALGAAGGAATVFQARVLSAAIGGAFLQGEGLHEIRPFLIVLAGLALVRAMLHCAGDVAAARAAQTAKAALRERLASHLVALGPIHARGERTGELTTVAVEGIEALDAYFGQYLPQLALAAVIPVTYLLVVFPNDPVSGIVLLVTAPLIPLFMVLIGDQTDRLSRRQWGALSRMSAHFLDVLQGLTTLKLFNRSREQARVIAEISERHRDATLAVLRVAFLSAFALEMVGTLSTAIIAVEIGLRLLYGRMAFQQALFVLLLAPEFYLPLRALGARFHAGLGGIAAARRIFAVLDTPVSGVEAGAPEVEPASDGRPPHIKFAGVSFAYPDRSGPALQDVSFDMLPGETVALVGPTGSGKSTIASLLLRFGVPQAGEITADGVPLGELDAESWRSRIAWVPQLPYLFDGSVRDNISLGMPDAPCESVIAAARRAGAHEFIGALPQGYDTPLGERALRLSGGQLQRIALARAFLRNAPLVLLDEATAHLDLATEDQIQASLKELLAGRSALVIAHRLATVSAADRIVVLDEGRVVEVGRHQELVAQGGVYARMVAAAGEGAADGHGSINEPAEASSPTLSLPTARLDLRLQPVISPRRDRVSGVPRPLPFLLSLLRPYLGRAALAVLLSTLTVGASIGLLGTSAWLIASAALAPSIAVLQVAIVGVRFFGIARGVFRYLERLASHQVTFRVLARLRVWFYEAIEPVSPVALQGEHSGDVLSRAVGDVGVLENFYVRALAPPLVALAVGALTSALLAAFLPALVLPYLVLYACATIAAPALVLALSHSPGRRLAPERGALNAALVDCIQGMPDLVAFGAAPAFLGRLRLLGTGLGRTQLDLAVAGAAGSALAALLTHLVAALALLVALPEIGAGRLPGVMLACVVLLALAGFEAVQPLPMAAQSLEACFDAARRLLDFTGKNPRPHLTVETAAPMPGAETKPSPPAIEIRHLSYRYGEGEPLALHDLSMRIDAGRRVAIVGPSGAGKSTLAALLVRFLDCGQGEIFMNGRDLGAGSPEAVRRGVAVVAQNTYLFNTTIAGNLLLARRGATQAELEGAARLAQVHDFIVSLPQGYDTPVGEQGKQLSGGERQRLAVARALLKDAPFIILDEPAANLDPSTERRLWDAIDPLLAGRTALVITHRLRGLERMDRIFVLEAGRLLESGTHAELVDLGGYYARMWERELGVLDGP